jgi:Phospholipase_D-nuclease N-terminal
MLRRAGKGSVLPVFFGFFGGFFYLIVTAFWIWVLVDCIRVPDDSMYKAGNKVVWVVVIVFTYFIGAIVYLIVGRAGGGPTSVSPPGPPPPMPPPPV